MTYRLSFLHTGQVGTEADLTAFNEAKQNNPDLFAEDGIVIFSYHEDGSVAAMKVFNKRGGRDD